MERNDRELGARVNEGMIEDAEIGPGGIHILRYPHKVTEDGIVFDPMEELVQYCLGKAKHLGLMQGEHGLIAEEIRRIVEWNIKKKPELYLR